MYHNYHLNKNTLFLGGYLFSLSIYLIVHYTVFESNSKLAIAILFKHFSPIFYLPGAMIYLYVRGGLNNNQQLSKKDLLHFIPFIISAINIFPYYFTPFELKLELAKDIYTLSNFSKLSDKYLFYPFYLSAFIRSILFILYIGGCMNQIWNHKKHSSGSILRNKPSINHWLVFITTSGFILAICLLVISIIFYTHLDIARQNINSHFFVVLAGFCFLHIPVAMIFFPVWIYGEKGIISTSQSKQIPRIDKVNIDPKKEELNELAKRIIECFDIQQPFLQKDFNLDKLSEMLDTPKYQLYNALNSILHKKFTQIRAIYRVEHVKKLLSVENFENISLEEVWKKSGFSSKSNFFTTFKEETGITPIDYIEQINTSSKIQ